MWRERVLGGFCEIFWTHWNRLGLCNGCGWMRIELNRIELERRVVRGPNEGRRMN